MAAQKACETNRVPRTSTLTGVANGWSCELNPSSCIMGEEAAAAQKDDAGAH